MTQNECKNFERILARQSAPSILGIKPASLISIDKNKFSVEENVSYFNSRAAQKGLKIRVLREYGERKMLIVYSEKLLKKQFEDAAVRQFFSKFGYSPKMTVDEYIDKLAGKISSDGEFPHEVGVFLGYPIEDVAGFIDNKGENYLFCGYWKVYSNAENARKTFTNYNKCRNYLCEKLKQGADIYQAIKIS